MVRDSGEGLLAVPCLDGWAAQWDSLVDLSPIPSPFLRSWWLSGAGGRHQLYLLYKRDAQLLGGLALEERRHLGLPCLRMTGSGGLCPDHLDLLARPEHEDAAVSAIRAWLHRPGVRLIDLQGIRTDSRLIAALPGEVLSETLGEAPWTDLPTDARRYQASRPAGLRKTLKRASARLKAEGAHHSISRGPLVDQALSRLGRLHRAQWGNRSRFLPDFHRFAQACRLGADVDEVAVHELMVAGATIAIMVCFEVAGRVSLYQSARLTDARWRDATTVLLSTIITDACERGFTEVDFLRGEEPYKTRFAPRRRALVRLRTATGLTGRLAMAIESAARRAKSVTDLYRTRDLSRRVASSHSSGRESDDA